MKMRLFIFGLLAFLATALLSSQRESTPFSPLARKYFGQKVPGMKAKLFAPGLISLEGRHEFALSFSQLGDELLFSVQILEKPACVYYTRIVEGTWTKPKLVSLSKGAKKEEMEAFFSWDGRYIFFAPYDEGLDVRIWKIDINEDGWRNPQPLKGQITDESAFFPTCSKKGTLYYSNITQGKIYKALLEKSVVKESGEAGLEFGGHGFIAPDESFILIDSIQDDGHGKQDIYVAFRNEDGGWSTPVNLGDEVNTEHNETCPTLSSDGKYLFFSRYNEPGEISNIYWIDSRVIEEARRAFIPRWESNIFEGLYLGQKPPGMTPEIFAPGIISTENLGEANSIFTKNGDMLLFNRRRPPEGHKTIYFTEVKNGFWTKPSPVPFNSQFADWDFHFAPDGKTFYFTSKRPVNQDNRTSKQGNIWVTKLTHSGWAEPCMLEYPVNTPGNHDCGGTLTNDGTLYFFSQREGGLGQSDIYRARLKDGRFVEVGNLGKPINSEYSDYDSFVAPDESYLIFSSDRPGGYGEYNDIYIAFSKTDGTWTEPINLGYEFRDSGINGVTLDNRFLFYTCGRTGNDDIYWVDAKIIKALKPDEFPVLKGPYLGQKPPGMTPEIFAPGIISTGYNERIAAFTPDGKEFYYSLYGAPHMVVLFTKEENGRWTKPQVAPFSGKYRSEFNISPDGNKIVFWSRQPLDGQGPETETGHTWIVERTDSGWSEPRALRPDLWGYSSFSSNGNLYFNSGREGGMGGWDVYVAKLIDGEYAEPENLGEGVNGEGHEIDPFIAPDESYLVFLRRPEEDFELLVSFRKDDGSWTKAKKMGEPFESSAWELCPTVTPDGKYFFFTSYRSLHKSYSDVPLTYEDKLRILNSPGNGLGDIYWVDAKIIEQFRPDELK